MMEIYIISKKFKEFIFWKKIKIIWFVNVETNPRLRYSPILITIVKIWKNVKLEII
jgi:hypothetical protein